MTGKRTAYSLVEMIVVVMILGVMAFIAIPRINFTGLHRKQANAVAKKIVADLRRTRTLAISNAAVNNVGFRLQINSGSAALPAPPPALSVASVPVSHAAAEPVYLLSVSVAVPITIATTITAATSTTTSTSTGTGTATATKTSTSTGTATATTTSTGTGTATATKTSTSTSTSVSVSSAGYKIVDASSGSTVDTITIDSGISCTGGTVFTFGPLGNLLSDSRSTPITVSSGGASYTITVIPATGIVECTGG